MTPWRNQRVLVAGGTGLIGIPLVKLLLEEGADVKVAAASDPYQVYPKITELIDLTDYQNCLKVAKNIDYVFNLMCIKGSPAAMEKHPARFFDTIINLSRPLATAALDNKVPGYLYASSVAVYQPAEMLYEDDVWKTQPSPNDWFAGHAKRIGELQIEAYRKEYHWTNTAIVRPSNVYGPYDNFDPESSLFMAYIIRKFAEKQSPIFLSGDGSQVRDFIHAQDAARGMIIAAENPFRAVNLCSGIPTTVKEVVEILARNSDYKPKVIFDTTKPAGDQRRLLDPSRLKAMGFEPQTSLEDGIKETLRWYLERNPESSKQYNMIDGNFR